MAIPGVSDEVLRGVLAKNLTPSSSIKTPERLFGRQRNLTTIDRALNSPGRQIFIYGDRGVGKTSLALTAAYLHTHSGTAPIHVMCGTTSTFSQVMHAMGSSAIPIENRVEGSATGGGLKLTAANIGGVEIARGNKPLPNIVAPQSLNEALDLVRYVASKRRERVVIVIDEMERLAGGDERVKFAEFIKNSSEIADNVRFIFCGIAHDVTELLESHPSAGRILETIKLERLNHSDLWQIITAVGGKLGVEVQREALVRIGQISDGFPHYVHLIGESMFWSMFDDSDSVTKSGPAHFKAGIEGALQRTEAVLRHQYDRATQKTRNTADYEEALWALADSTSDRRQVTEIYDKSYGWIVDQRKGRTKLTRERLNQRYLSLRKESHGRIVAGYGSGWFSFRENIMRGYVRLRAASEGIDLGRHHNTAGMA
jgi:archaellum biogenesis ATPase FlaH